MSMKIYTRTGDEGETGLFGGGRVPKDHPRVSAYGDVDELNSSIGVARAIAPLEFFDPLLESVQRDLFAIGGHLATPDPGKVAKALEKAELSEARVAEFERVMDAADEELPALRAFVLPGGDAQGGRAAPRPHRVPPRGAERGPPRARIRGAATLRGLPQSPVGSALHAGPPGQSSRWRGRRHMVSAG